MSAVALKRANPWERLIVGRAAATTFMVLRSIALAAEDGTLTARESVRALMARAKLTDPETWMRHRDKLVALGAVRRSRPKQRHTKGRDGSWPDEHTILELPQATAVDELDHARNFRTRSRELRSVFPGDHVRDCQEPHSVDPNANIKQHLTSPRNHPPRPAIHFADRGRVTGGMFSDGWTADAIAEINDMRSDPQRAHFAAFFDRIAGTRNPPINANAAAYVREIAAIFGGQPADVVMSVANGIADGSFTDEHGKPWRYKAPTSAHVGEYVRLAAGRRQHHKAHVIGDPTLSPRWANVMERLNEEIGKCETKAWFDLSAPMRIDDGAIVIGQPAGHLANFCRQKYAYAALRAATAVYGTEISSVMFVVATPLGTALNPNPP